MRKSVKSVKFPLIHSHACGIDIGSRSNWVCVGKDKDHVREFGVFTEEHHALAKWLKSNKVQTIAMESTGIYWKPLFLILQAYGFEVLLVNAAHIKNVRGKKSDVSDCQWIWQLHRSGLLKGSFQPDVFTEELRTYNRQRQNLIEGAAHHISRMQKALVLMNLQLPLVLTNIMGKSGRAIIGAILAGERDGKKLAALAHNRVKADKETIAKALEGQWHRQYLFTLRQSWELYHSYQEQIARCDTEIETLLQSQVEHTGQNDLDYPSSPKRFSSRNLPKFDVGKYAYQLSDGVDLLAIDGVGYNLVMTLAAEVGFDLASSFPSAKQFTSWMGLCPNKRITGGKVLSSKSKRNKSKLAQAFRYAANSVGNQRDTPLSDFFRRIAFRKGRKAAITATARKLAVIVYHMLVNKQPYQPEGLEAYRDKVRKQKIKYIQKTIERLDIEAKELAFS